jgi:hypothetical protein
MRGAPAADVVVMGSRRQCALEAPYRDGLLSRRRDHDRVASLPEHGLEQRADAVLALDDEDRCRRPMHRHVHFSVSPSRRGSRRSRQVQREATAAAWRAVNRDLTASLAHDPVNHGEPEASATSHVFGGEKRLEHPLADALRDADAGVTDAHERVRALGDAKAAGEIGVEQ